MSDALLTRIAVALETIAAASGGIAPVGGAAPVGATSPGPAPSTGAITADSLTQLVQPLVQDEGTKEKVRAVLTKYGLNRLGEAQESQYAALHAEFTAIASAPAQPAAEQSLI